MGRFKAFSFMLYAFGVHAIPLLSPFLSFDDLELPLAKENVTDFMNIQSTDIGKDLIPNFEPQKSYLRTIFVIWILLFSVLHAHKATFLHSTLGATLGLAHLKSWDGGKDFSLKPIQVQLCAINHTEKTWVINFLKPY